MDDGAVWLVGWRGDAHFLLRLLRNFESGRCYLGKIESEHLNHVTLIVPLIRGGTLQQHFIMAQTLSSLVVTARSSLPSPNHLERPE